MEQRPLLPLLAEAKELVVNELHRRLHEEGYDEIRPAHGCVFRFIQPEGTRLTDLGAESRAAGVRIMGEIEAEWAERLGEDAVASLREVLEAVTGNRVPA